MRVRCPQCRNPIELASESSLSDINCPSCGSDFSLLGEETVAWKGETQQTIGHFELVEEVGVGAFGSVYKARDTDLDRTVAVKIPRKGQLNPEETEQFLREARAAAQLRHPNIVGVHEVGRDGDSVYIVSDFVEGLTLGDWLTGQQLTSREAAQLCAKLADALHHAHEAGVIHRDLKPANVILDRDGEPHLMDFGLARREVGEVTMTAAGKVLGTPTYMSPEQARGEAHHADRRSDIYSLGVILFELLTGEKPFRGNVRMLIHQVLTEEPPSPRKLVGTIPRDLETICLKCLEKYPDRRYQTAAELSAELRRWLNGEPIHARPISAAARAWRWCRRKPLVAGLSATAVLLLVAVAVVASVGYVQVRGALGRESAALGVATTERNAARKARDAEAEQRRKAEALADENKQLAELERQSKEEAEAAKEEFRRQLYISDMNLASQAYADGSIDRMKELLLAHLPTSGEADLRGFEWYYWWRAGHLEQGSIRNPTTGPLLRLAVAPDGNTVAATGFPNTVYVFDSADLRLLHEPLDVGTQFDALSFSPDGTFLLAGDAFTGAIRLFSTGDWTLQKTLQATGGTEAFAFSPTEPLMASGGRGRQIVLWNTATWRRLVTLPAGGLVWSLAFAPDGSSLVAGVGNTVVAWDVASRKVIRTLDEHEERVTSVVFSPDGSLLATGSRDETVRLWNGQAEIPIQTLQASAPVVALAFSPDGNRLLAGTTDNNSVLVWDVPSQPPQQIATMKGHSRRINALAFVGDSKTVWSASEDGFIKAWDLSHCTPYETLRNVAASTPVAYAADGRTLVFQDDQRAVQRWDVGAHKFVTALGGGEEYSHLAVSDDGAVVAGRAGGLNPPALGELRVWDLVSDKLLFKQPTTSDNPSRITVTEDGRTVAWTFSHGGEKGLVVRDMASGTTKDVPDPDVHPQRRPVFSPDGKLLVVQHQSRHWVSTVWDVGADPPAVRYEVSGWGPELCAAFSPDGDTLAIGSYNYDIRLHDALSGELMHTLQGHTDIVNSLAFSRDGSRLVSGSKDGTVRIWDPHTGELLSTLTGHAGEVLSVAIAPDGTSVASHSDDQIVRLWDARPAYVEERSPRLLPGLDRKMADGAATADDFKLRGQIHARQGDWDQAASDFDQAVKLASSDAEVPLAFQTSWWVVGGYPGELETPFAPETNPDPFQPIARPQENGGEPEMVPWSLGVHSEADTFNLSAYCEHRDDVTAYALTKLYAPRARNAAILASFDDQVRLWLNGKLVFERGGTRSLGAGDNVVEVTLQPGWNTLLAKVVNLTGPHALRLRLSDDPRELAIAYEQSKNWAEALRHWTRILDEDPQDVNVRLRRAGAALRTDDYDLAAKDFAFVIEHMDDPALARRLVAGEYAEHLTRSAPLEAFTEAVNLAPESSAFRVLRAEAFLDRGRSEEAATDLARALAISPASVDELAPLVVELATRRALVFSSQTRPVVWRYTFSRPADGWQNFDFDDAGWGSGPAPFGSWGKANTNWSESIADIWLRTEFVLPSPPAPLPEGEGRAVEAPLVVRAFIDDSAEIYLNGVPAATGAWVESQRQLRSQELPCDEAAVRSLRPGTNILAVHCHNDDQGARIDVGLYQRLDRSEEDLLLEVLSRALEARPDSFELLSKRSEEYVHREVWKEAASDLLKLVELDPNVSNKWLHVAPVLVLAGDRDGYRRHVERMASQFANSDVLSINEQVTKAGLLWSGAVEISQLPLEKFTNALDDGSAPDWFQPWGFACRALAAYRAGDAKQALHWVPKTLATQGTPPCRALCLAIQALAQHKLGKLAEARVTLKQAADLIDPQLSDIKTGTISSSWPDWLIADVLRREAARVMSDEG